MSRPRHAAVVLLLSSFLLSVAALLGWPSHAPAASRQSEVKTPSGAARLSAGQGAARSLKRGRPAPRQHRWPQDPALSAILARSRAPLPGEASGRVTPVRPLTAPEREALEDSLQEEVALSSMPALAPHPSVVAFAWPVVGRLNSPFGPRRARFHTGLDIGAPQGSPVVAAADGRVLYARASRGPMGKTIVLEHVDGLRTVYAHLSQLGVKEGRPVRQGDRIGAVGRTGRATGPHLHFEIRDQGTPLPPQEFLPGGDEGPVETAAGVTPPAAPDQPESASTDTSAAPAPTGAPSS
jgi:murein DD-endopeptidase MepM/ murein hydrolase activator NlpD